MGCALVLLLNVFLSFSFNFSFLSYCSSLFLWVVAGKDGEALFPVRRQEWWGAAQLSILFLPGKRVSNDTLL